MLFSAPYMLDPTVRVAPASASRTVHRGSRGLDIDGSSQAVAKKSTPSVVQVLRRAEIGPGKSSRAKRDPGAWRAKSSKTEVIAARSSRTTAVRAMVRAETFVCIKRVVIDADL